MIRIKRLLKGVLVGTLLFSLGFGGYVAHKEYTKDEVYLPLTSTVKEVYLNIVKHSGRSLKDIPKVNILEDKLRRAYVSNESICVYGWA